MGDLISWYFNVPHMDFVESDGVFYAAHQNSYIYIIPIGSEKTTTFFHLLQLIQNSSALQVIPSREGELTVTFSGQEYYAIMSNFSLHEKITLGTLKSEEIYNAPYKIAHHYKNLWISKNQLHESTLQAAIEKVAPVDQPLLFDIATYYIHMSEQAYSLLTPIEYMEFHATLCHARATPQIRTYELLMPEFLIIDNKSRNYCECIRHQFLESYNFSDINQIVAYIHANDPLNAAEWAFLYARLYFPTHFYDCLHDIQNGSPEDITALYEHTLHYQKLLINLPQSILDNTGITLQIPAWILSENNF